jgi:hypothetical protein
MIIYSAVAGRRAILERCEFTFCSVPNVESSKDFASVDWQPRNTAFGLDTGIFYENNFCPQVKTVWNSL